MKGMWLEYLRIDTDYNMLERDKLCDLDEILQTQYSDTKALGGRGKDVGNGLVIK